MKHRSEVLAAAGNIVPRLEESKYYSTPTNPLRFTCTHSLYASILKITKFQRSSLHPEENYMF